jgi:hypothetical protein
MAKIGKKSLRKNQKVYRMKGCSKKTRKNYLGGDADVNLAYTGHPSHSTPNPFLAYTGKGGSCKLTPASVMPDNVNAANKAIPNTGPPVGVPTAVTNQAGAQKGGNCGCGMPMMNGGGKKMGGCGPLCAMGFMVGGKHRLGCKCSTCKNRQSGGNPGIPYPDGLVGKPWTPAIGGWPGVGGVQGDNNYYAPNTYNTDVQTAMISTGAQPPFSVCGKKKGTRKQRGGNLSNFFGQDLINLGRQFQFSLGSAYNGLAGYASPVNPMPWKGQLPNTPSLSTVKAASL